MINKEEFYKLIFYFVAAVTASLIRFIRIQDMTKASDNI